METRAGFRSGSRSGVGIAAGSPLNPNRPLWKGPMAIPHLQHRTVGKSTHGPGAASAHLRYITRSRAASEVMAEHMPDRQGPAMRWMDAQEQAARKNARLVDKIIIALPRELDAEQRAQLVRDFAGELTDGRVPWIAAIHDMGKDAQNPHAHLAIRDRDVETGKRVLRLSDNERDRRKAGLEPNGTRWVRQVWEETANRALERAGRPERIDMRSLEAQGIDREPTVHVGPKANALETKNEVPPSRVASDNSGREIRWPEIDGGLSRAEHNRAVRTRNRLAGARKDQFRQAVGQAWQDLVSEQKRDIEESVRRREAAELRERKLLKRRQERRAEIEARSDEKKRPKGVVGFVFKLIGKAAKIEKQIEQAQVRRAERDAEEWIRLEARQNEHRASLARSYSFMHDLERKEFRREAARLHAEIAKGKSIREARKTRPVRIKTRQRYRDDDDDGRSRGGRGRGQNLTP